MEVKECNEKYPDNEKNGETPTKHYGYGVRHIQIACMSLCFLALLTSRTSMGVAVLAMTDTSRNDTSIEIYDWDKQTQGLILSSFFWGYFVMQIPGGMLAKRFGGKPILLVALLANGVSNLMLPLLTQVGGWQMVCASRVVMGLTQACLFPASHTLFGQWLPTHELTTVSGIVLGGAPSAIIVGMALSGVLAETTLGWKMIFYVMAGLLFFVAGVWHFFAASSPGEHRLMTEKERIYIEKGLNTPSRKSLRTPWKAIFKTRGMWAILAAHISLATGFVLFFNEMPTYLKWGLQISLKNSAILSSLPYAGMMVSGVASSAICQRMVNSGRLSVLTCRKIFNSLNLFGYAAALMVQSFIGPEHKSLAIANLILGVAMTGCSSAGFMVNHLDLSPNYAGVLLSLTNFVANIGSIVTPIITSFILQNDPSDLSRWRIVFLLVAALSVVSNVVYLVFSTAERQPWDDPNFDGTQNHAETAPLKNQSSQQWKRK